MSIEAMKQALEALKGNCTNPVADPEQAAAEDKAITALRQAIEQAEKPHPYQYVEVRIKVGDFHIKKVMTEMEYSKAHDPIKLLSLLADDCVQHLKEVV